MGVKRFIRLRLLLVRHANQLRVSASLYEDAGLGSDAGEEGHMAVMQRLTSGGL